MHDPVRTHVACDTGDWKYDRNMHAMVASACPQPIEGLRAQRQGGFVRVNTNHTSHDLPSKDGPGHCIYACLTNSIHWPAASS
jgi:hypothetical protein